MSDNAVSTRVIVDNMILSYPHVDQPQLSQQPKPGEKPKYSAAFVSTPNTKNLPALKAAIIEAARKKFGDTIAAPNGAKLTIQQAFDAELLKYPLHTNALAKGYPEGSTFFNARSEQKPGAVYAHAAPGTTRPAPIADEDIKSVLYPGAIVNVSVTAFGYNRDGGKGVGLALNNVQKIADGDRLDSQKSAEDEFTADLSQTPADLSQVI